MYESGDSSMRVGRPLDAPHGLAGHRVDLQDVRRVVGVHPVQHLHVQRVAVQQRRRGVAELDAERAVVLLDVARPEFLAGEVEGLEDAGAGHHPDVLAVGDRRRRRHVLLVADPVARPTAAASRRPPACCDRPPTARSARWRARWRRSGRSVSFQMMGVEPLKAGSGSFHATFSVALQVVGRPFSVLTPSIDGPRQCGQVSAAREASSRGDHREGRGSVYACLSVSPEGTRPAIDSTPRRWHRRLGVREDDEVQVNAVPPALRERLGPEGTSWSPRCARPR